MAQTAEASSADSLTHDEDYYFEDGDCILQVERYLFNLHRFILRRNSVFFRNMFSMPQAVHKHGGVEGECDEYPILCNDSAKAFRALCWALYAGLKELEGKNECELHSEEGFAHIGFLAHKYECNQIEQWARRNLDSKLAEYLETRHSSSDVLKSREKLVYLVRTSMQCDWTFAKRASEKIYLEVIKSGWLVGAESASKEDLSGVLELANSVSSVHLKAEAYHTFLECVRWNLPPTIRISTLGEYGVFTSAGEQPTNQACLKFLEALSDAQKVTLYQGLHALYSLRVGLQSCPTLINPCRCYKFTSAVKIWDTVANDSEKGCPEKFMKEVKKRLGEGYESIRHKRCTSESTCGWLKINTVVDRFLGRFDEILVDVFSG